MVQAKKKKKTNALPNLITHQPNLGKVYSNAKDSYESKNQLLIEKRENADSNIVMILFNKWF